MPTTLPKCPKCAGTMQTGFILDLGHNDRRRVATWIEGKPEPAFWLGLDLKDRANLPCVAFRCTDCGFLEFYAIDPARV